MDRKIKLLVIPSDYSGCGYYRSTNPHLHLQEMYPDEFDVDIVYLKDIPTNDTEKFFKQYDLIHIHKMLDKNLMLMNMIKFLGIPVIVDVDDAYKLGDHHPMSISAQREKWHEPIVAHLRAADYVSTTTDIYAKKLLKHNKNVLVFPNAIDPNDGQCNTTKNPNPSGRLRVGIICGSSHLRDLEILRGVSSRVPIDKVQFLLCGFDTNGTRTIYHQDTGQVERRNILPKESVWYEYEKIVTDNYKIVSPEHKEFLMQFMAGVDDPFTNEPYRRMWTRNINKYRTHFDNVDVLLAPLDTNDFNAAKSQLKETECAFTHTAFIAQNFGAYTIDLTNMMEKGGKINEDATAILIDPAKNHKNWAKAITLLANRPDLVTKLQDNLYKFGTETYHIDKICAERAEAYRKIVAESVAKRENAST